MRTHDFENNPLDWERLDRFIKQLEPKVTIFREEDEGTRDIVQKFLDAYWESAKPHIRDYIHQVRQEAYVKGQTDGYEYGYRVAAEGVIESIAPDDGVDYGLVRRDLKSQLKQRWLGEKI
jgi:flagellar biosynthesis/type III secretory pathway protein FliH